MDAFVARQPILDTHRAVVAYELLYRTGPENRFPGGETTMAAATVIEQALGVFGLDVLVPNARAFVNISRRVLVEELYRVLPPDRVVLEILENVEADAQTLAACDSARALGYQIALDDYAFGPEHEPFLAKVHVVKVDWPTVDKATLVERVAPLHQRNLRLLAEKVETQEDVTLAEKAGFQLFQGYFFFRPEMLRTKDIPASKLNSIQLLRVLGQPTFRMHDVETLLQRDISLSVRLLRYLNSAAFSLRTEVTSLHQALIFLGERPLRCWLSVAALSSMGGDRPAELLTTCLVRARCCELLGAACPHPPDVDAFLLGMLSLVDALLGRPLAEVLAQTGVSKALEAALLRHAGPAGSLLDTAVDLEQARFDSAARNGVALGLSEEKLASAYTQAVTWADQVMRTW